MEMSKIFKLTIVGIMVILVSGGAEVYADPQISFVQPPTPVDGAVIADSSVEIEVSITEAALEEVTFVWDTYYHYLYDSSLVLMLNFDNVALLGENYGVAGDVVKDLSGHGNDGYLSDAGLDPARVPAWMSNGRYGGAFDFTGNGSGSGQSIRVLHSDSLNPYGGSGDFAVMVWILTRDDFDGDILRKGSTNTATTWYKIEHAPGGDLDTISLNFNASGTDATVTSPQVYNDNQWHFVVAQRRSDQAELWIDGVLVGSAPVSGDIANSADLAIGSKDTQNDDFLNSSLDEVRMYMRSFSAAEIELLYFSNLNKYDADKWTLYVNQLNLANGLYEYQASASNSAVMSSTESREVTVAVGQNPTVSLDWPVDGSITNLTDVVFISSATGGIGLLDASLYVGDPLQMISFSGPAQSADAQIYATDDGSTGTEEGPGTNAGNAVSINIDGANPHAHGVIRFDVFDDEGGQIPRGSTITSATLEINCTNPGNVMKMYRLTEDWVESEVTWNNSRSGVPWTNGGADGTGSNAGFAIDGDCLVAGVKTFDITQFVQEWSDGSANYGIVLTNSGSDGVDFDSSESANPPVLAVTYGQSNLQWVETKTMSGTNDMVSFSPVTLVDQQGYIWNCLVRNISSLESWAPADFSLTVDTQYQFAPLKGPYVQNVTSDSMVIMWETSTAMGSRVDFGLAAADEFYVQDASPVTIHEVQLTGLAADTTYYYKVTSDGQTGSTYTFTTAPAVDRPIEFVVYGDTRTWPVEHELVIQSIIDNSDPEFVINVGDLVQDGGQYGDWGNEFFDPAHDLMVDTPMYAVLGNHEYNSGGPQLYFDFLSLPGNEEWYAFTYGNIRCIGLNTMGNYSPGSAQRTWLESELQSTDYSDATWHVVVLHHPPFTATSGHGDDEGVKQDLVPLFEQYGVDIVFAGHSHVYERYTHNGIFYIVTGGGGAPPHSLVNDTVVPIREVGEGVLHHCEIDATSTSFTCTALRQADGSQIDQVMITNDAEPPVITAVTGDTSGTTGESATIEATITDNGNVAAATVHYTPIDGTETTVSMTEGASDRWSADVAIAPDKVGAITYYITAVDDSANTATDPAAGTYSITVTDNDAPAAVSDLTGTAIAGGAIQVAWTAVTDNVGVASYNIYREATEITDLTSLTPMVTGIVFPSYTDFATVEGTSYYYSVIALDDAANEGAVSNSPSATSDATGPVISAVASSNILSTEATITWTTDEPSNSTILYGTAIPLGTSQSDAAMVTAHSVVLTGLSAVTTYYYEMMSTDAAGNASADNNGGAYYTFTTTSPPGPASDPSPAIAAANVSIDADLTWTAGSDTTSHDVYFGTVNPPPAAGNQAPASYDPGTLANGTTYYWRIDEVGPGGTTTGTVWSFTTIVAAPGSATNPSPALAAADIAIDADLTWTAGSDTTSHDVYFGTDTDPRNNTVANQGSNSFDPGVLQPGTTYYWAIDEIGPGGTTAGATWSFTTAALPGQASDPSPAGGAVDIATDTNLTWTAGSDTTSHDVYFGTDSDPRNNAVVNQTSNSFDPGLLQPSTTYYWTVDELGPGGTSAGGTWSFTTSASLPWNDDVANGEMLVSGTAVLGSYVDTVFSDNSYEGIAEGVQGKGKNARSILEHVWTINVMGGSEVLFNVEAFHTPNAEGDNFVFAYSTDELNYTNLLTVSKTVDDDTVQTAALPSSLSGTVFIRVLDTNRSKSRTALDTIFIDQMFVRSMGGGSPDTTPPSPDPTWAIVPQATGATSIAMTATTVTDVSGVEYYFTCTAGGGGHDSGWQDSTSYEDTGLVPETTYTYTVTARDKSASQNTTGTSSEASATTLVQTGDVVTITKAEYKLNRSELNVEATSSNGGTPVLTVVGYGDMTYDSGKNKYKLKIRPVGDPGGTVTVTSSDGGSATVTVTYR